MKFSNGLRILNYDLFRVFMTDWQRAQYTIEFRYVWLNPELAVIVVLVRVKVKAIIHMYVYEIQ